MNIYLNGLHYDEESRQIQLVNYRIIKDSGTTYSPEYLHQLLIRRIQLARCHLDKDVLVALTNSYAISSIYFIQSGAQTYTLFSKRLSILYALLSFRNHFVFVHYDAFKESKLPNVKDDTFFKNLTYAFTPLDLTLLDYLIIGKDYWYSYQMQKESDLSPLPNENPLCARNQSNDRAA